MRCNYVRNIQPTVKCLTYELRNEYRTRFAPPSCILSGVLVSWLTIMSSRTGRVGVAWLMPKAAIGTV